MVACLSRSAAHAGSSGRLSAPSGRASRVRCRSLSGGGGGGGRGSGDEKGEGASFKKRASTFAGTLGDNLRKTVDYEIYKSVDQLDQMVDTSRMNVKAEDLKSLDELENANLNAWTSAVPLVGGAAVIALLIIVNAPTSS
mmetsp:Transcript_387/g.989  ORF Transcript_387/g.989 Transcript_387/m.989 type:complete len:140 (+) Transcript_387:210-629(+)